jgi:two-component system, sensor histidine kinase and response regulator
LPANHVLDAGLSEKRLMNIDPLKNHRILVIDDNRAIHEDFRKILIKGSNSPNDLNRDEAILFGGAAANSDLPLFEIDSAYQGEEGLALIEISLLENKPYAMAFVDVRMPPGWDGVETTCKIWERYSDLQVVICTAFSDYSWEEMLRTLGYSDRMIILKKPFDNIEVLQLAVAMTEKWRLYQQSKIDLNVLEKLVQERTRALKTANSDLSRANLLLIAGTEKAQRMADTALAASDAKSGFLSDMSHEIRKPMKGVIGMIDLLLDTEQTVEQSRFAKTIRNSAYSLLLIINDILDFSKIEAGKMIIERVDFDLGETIKNAIELMLPVAQCKGLKLGYSIKKGTSTDLVGDPVRIRQILLNLLSNAIKFSERGEVLLEVIQTSEIGEEVELSFLLHDSGLGMSVETQKKLLRCFAQANPSTARVYGGVGQELAISRKLVELMGGRVEAQSSVGKGSTFSFILQFTKKEFSLAARNVVGQSLELTEERGKPVAAVVSKGTRILLAEDGKSNQAAAIQVLQKLGCTADIACNGLEAVEAWQRNRYEIILMDCHMPKMDGYEATRKIRSLEEKGSLKATHIIAMTASAMAGDREFCLASGMNDYTSKPVDQMALTVALRKVGRGF